MEAVEVFGLVEGGRRIILTSYSWGVSPLAVPSPRSPLNRDRVVDAALAIVDRDGLGGLTMRRLAAELGVEAMSLYHWFPNKAAILDALVEAALRETASVAGRDQATGWRESLRALAVAYRHVLKAHPNTLTCISGRPGKSVEAMRYIEQMLEVLRSDGFSPDLATKSMQAVLAYITGAVSAEVGRPGPHGSTTEISARFPRDEFPRLYEVATLYGGPPPEGDESFAFGLEALLDGIGQRLAATRVSPAAPARPGAERSP
jgi:AcrR family transcriptional regulator